MAEETLAEFVDARLGEIYGSGDSSNGTQPIGDLFTKDEGLIVPQLCEAIASVVPIKLGLDGRLYRYVGGVYRGDRDAYVKGQVKVVLGERFKKRHMEEVLAWFRAGVPEIGGDLPAGLVNVGNGILDLARLKLRPHSPDVLSTAQLPVEWDPNATCPAVSKFFGEVLGDELSQLVVEIIGYGLYPTNPYRVAVLLLGPGRNGKSRLLGLIRALLGTANVSAVPLQVLTERPFASAQLLHKLANIAGALDARAVRRSDLFKMITGGDSIMAEHKYGQAFNFVPGAKLLFSANEAPMSSDQSDAWFDRWVIVPIERRIPDDQVDVLLESKLTTPDELSGLLVLAVEGLRRLMLRGAFGLPKAAREAGDKYRDRLDTVRGFVVECCVLHPDSWSPRSALYRSYRQWCSESGRMAVSADRFYDHLRTNYIGEVEESRRHGGTRGFIGIGLAA